MSKLLGSNMRYAVSISYEGTNYYGWQRLNTGLSSVQAKVEEAFSTVANHSIAVVCAGRTDAGVHATKQIIHFDTTAERSERNWVFGANRYLPDDISVNWVKPVENTFHARFTAYSRRYLYIISNHVVKNAIECKGLTWCHNPLNVEQMQEGGKHLIGEHDFSAYRTVRCQARHAKRNIMRLEVKRFGRLVMVDIQANAFLHHMVRNIVGVLISIGEGKKSPTWTKDILNSRDRRTGGVTAPAHGLYFVDVTYPEKFNLPCEPAGPPMLSPFIS